MLKLLPWLFIFFILTLCGPVVSSAGAHGFVIEAIESRSEKKKQQEIYSMAAWRARPDSSAARQQGRRKHNYFVCLFVCFCRVLVFVCSFVSLSVCQLVCLLVCGFVARGDGQQRTAVYGSARTVGSSGSWRLRTWGLNIIVFMYGSCYHFNNLRFKKSHNINDH